MEKFRQLIPRMLPTMAAIALFFVVSALYFAPQFGGDTLAAHDTVQYEGMAQEIKQMRAETGEDPQWTGAMFGGNTIIKTFYQPFESADQSPAVLRYPIDLREMSTMETLWQKGLTLLETLIPAMPEGLKAGNGRYLAALGQYIQCSIRTVINIKRWYIANKKLQMEADRAAASVRIKG